MRSRPGSATAHAVPHAVEIDTSDISLHTIHHGPGGHRVHLIDTPGFDSNRCSDVEFSRHSFSG